MTRATILVVEDEGLVALDIQTRLEELGYEVEQPVASAAEALLSIENHPPDLVLLDIMLEGEVDGVELSGTLRRRYDLPVVFLTAYSDDYTLSRVRRSEAFGYLLKPFEERQLETTIEIALHKQKLEVDQRQRLEELRLALDHVGPEVAVSDPAGSLVFLSAGLTRKLSDLIRIGDPWTQLFPGLEETTWIGESTLSLADGAERLVEMKLLEGGSRVLVIDEPGSRQGRPAWEERVHRTAALGRGLAGAARALHSLSTSLGGLGKLLIDHLDESDPVRKELDRVLIGTAESTSLSRHLLSYHAAVAQVSAISDRLLLFSSPTPPRRSEVDVAALLSEIQADLRSGPPSMIEYDLDLADESPAVNTDPVLLRTALWELARNAAEAMPDGGRVQFMVQLGRFPHDDSRTSPGQTLKVVISDTGEGMDGTTQVRLFEPFYTTRGEDRMGLGASIAWSNIRTLGGEVLVKSEMQNGSTITVLLPIQDR